MAQNVGQSRGSQKHKQFVQDSANSYIVDAFKDMSEVAPGSPVDGEGYIVENVGSIDASWGTIIGLGNGDIIRWRQSKLAWQIVMAADAANQGFKAYVKDEDTLYAMDATAEWIVASGSGGGVKNFAQKQAGAYKSADWIKGNSGLFGAAGTLDGTFETETVSPLDGKKSFKYTTGSASGDDWFYLLVDIDQYARGGVIAFTFDYQWDGDEDIRVHIWDASLTNEYSTELNVLKNTTNDSKLSRNSRTIYAHPDTESQVVVGFQVASTESTGKTFIFDNLKVTDDIGVIGSGPETLNAAKVEHLMLTNTAGAASTYNPYFSTTSENSIDELGTWQNGSSTGFIFTASKRVKVIGTFTWPTTANTSGYATQVAWGKNSSLGQASTSLNDFQRVSISGGGVNSGSAYLLMWETTCNTILEPGDTLRAHHDGTSLGGQGTYGVLTLMVEEIQEDPIPATRFLQVPNGEKLENTFSAILPTQQITTNGIYTRDQLIALGMTDKGTEWIDYLNRFATGSYNLHFKSGFFTEVPAITATGDHLGGVAHIFVDIDDPTNNFTTMYTRNDGALSYDANIHIFVEKQGNDRAPDIVGVPVSIQGQTHEADTALEAQTFGGYVVGFGSNNVATFTTLKENRGSAATFVDNTYFQINESGLFHLSASAAHLSEVNWQIVKNFATAANVLAASAATTATTGKNASTTRWLNAGDIVFVSCGNPVASSNDNYWNFNCAKVGTQPLLDGGVVITEESKNINAFGAQISSGTSISTQTSDWLDRVETIAVGKRRVYFKPGLFTSAPAITVTGTTAGTIGSGGSTAEAYIRGNNNSYVEVWTKAQDSFSDIGFLITANRTTDHKYLSDMINVDTTRVYKDDPIAWQVKSASNTATAAGDYFLTSFNNLEVGKTYRISGRARPTGSTNSSTTNIKFRMNGVDVVLAQNSTTVAGYKNNYYGFSRIFTATASTIEFIKSNDATITTATTFIEVFLEELPFHSQTSKWT